jgi:hypothetical protein
MTATELPSFGPPTEAESRGGCEMPRAKIEAFDLAPKVGTSYHVKWPGPPRSLPDIPMDLTGKKKSPLHRVRVV